MHRRRLGNSDLEISRIGFGAWAAGGGSWAFSLGPQDDFETISAIHRAVELGINWIDTAPLYGLGHSEQVVAQALKGLPNAPLVFTKCGMPWDDSGRIVHRLKHDSLRRECEGSLRRLGTDVIDLYQIHWNKPAEDVEEAVETLAELQLEGKIRHIGVSNFNVEQLELASGIANIVSLQPPYSVLDRAIEDDILQFCGAHRIGVIIYSPMKSGLLSGKMTRERVEALPPDDLRRSKPEFNGAQLEQNLAVADTLREIGSRHGRSAAEVAVGWTLQNSSVDAAIVGMRRADHVNGIVGAADLTLSLDEMNEIAQCLSMQNRSA